jgi:hypothetical protein
MLKLRHLFAALVVLAEMPILATLAVGWLLSGALILALTVGHKAMTGQTLLLLTRLGVAVIAGVVALLGFKTFGWDTSLSVAVAIMGGFIVVQTLFSYLWARGSFGAPAPEGPSGAESNAWVDTAKLSITTQGVVLGLIAFAGKGSLNMTLRAGAASLALGVLVATAMYLVVLRTPPPTPALRRVASLLVSVQLWALAFGLICVVAGNWK